MFLLGFTFRYTILTLFALPLLLMSAIYLHIFIIISRHQRGRQLNHERSTLMRGVMSATGPIGTAATVNLPELMAAMMGDKEIDENRRVQLLALPEPLEKQSQLKLDRQSSAPTKATRVQLAHGDGVGFECTCDNKSRKFRGKLTRANTIGTNASRLLSDQERKANNDVGTGKALITLTKAGGQSSVSSLVDTDTNSNSNSNSNNNNNINNNNSQLTSSISLFKTRLKRTPTSVSGLTGDLRSGAIGRGGMKTSSVALSHMTASSSTYEPQRRHVHAGAVPQTKKKACITTLLILGTYFISYVPAIIYQVLTCIDDCPYPLYDISFSRRVLFGAMTTLLLIAKSIIDPFIYSYRMSEIQVAISRYMSKRRSKSSFIATSMHASQRFHNNNVSQINMT